ncbi:MAG: single-stranded-DNA-specific exonuclease RecJ [bacterium]
MLHFPEIFEALLISRGLSKDESADFINPSYETLHDPLLLPDMELARDRVIQAIENNEHIVIFSDYDADGIPGAAVLADFFRRAGYKNVSYYIPHRHDEGFGLNTDAIKECGDKKTKLIVTVDCGIADIKELAYAKELGMDVIVTDHHLSAGELPEAYAIVNPKRDDSKYPFSELCGAGLAYKLAQAILAKKSFGIKEGMEKWFLDLVAIATLSDMVPLVGENRVFAKFGLDVLRKSSRPGLQALMRRLRMDQSNLSEDDVVFMITPRINAASRMGVPQDAFELLSTDDPVEAERLAAHLEKINNERKGVVASLVKDAKKHLKGREKLGEVIVIGNPEWRPALLGLVANSLVEEYMRPAFVWGRDGDGALKGSCRSYNGCNLYELMRASEDHFLEFGGHAGAGGFSVTLEQLTTLEENLSEALRKLIKDQTLSADSQGPTLENSTPTIQINIKDIREELWDVVSLFAPFGMGNPKPVFKISCEIKNIRTFGKENNHLEITITEGKKDVKCISFFSSPASFSLLPVPGLPCHIHAHLENSYFRNRSEIRLRIVDIQ